MESVGLANAIEFCKRLSALDQKSLDANALPSWTYGLPTAAQWTSFAAGTVLSDAVTSENLPKQRDHPEPVGSLKENNFALHDVRGNVWEWCADRQFRGAAYNSRKGFIPELSLSYSKPEDPNLPNPSNVGFRCVLLPSTQTAQR